MNEALWPAHHHRRSSQHTDRWRLDDRLVLNPPLPCITHTPPSNPPPPAGLIPADTDYRLFSYRRAGTLPGIDVAQVFDGLAYHTNQDVADRVRPGTLQVCACFGVRLGEDPGVHEKDGRLR